jgi:hypothetical protein
MSHNFQPMPKSKPFATIARLEQMEIDLDAIGHALSDKRLCVPIYQRSYAWTETHVTDLLQDMATAIDDGEAEYFLGSIVATAGSDERQEIVDGQQRLATTSILMAAIRDYFFLQGDKDRASDIEREYLSTRDIRTQEATPKLRLNDNDNDFYAKRILTLPGHADRKVAPTKNSHHRIAKAAEISAKHVSKLATLGNKPTERLLALLDFISKRAKVIWVLVPDHANAFTIFETLNDRGLELAISDLLKNYLFLSAENRLPEVQAQWIAMIATLEAVENEAIAVDFIRHQWSSTNGATRERELYSTIKKSITSKQGAVDFAKQLAAGAKLYAAMLNTDHELWKKYGATARGHMATINVLQMVQIRPLLLAVLDRFAVPEVRKALKLMVSWGTRFLITGGHGAGTLEKQYSSRAQEVRKGQITTAKELAMAMLGVVPTDKVFETGFATASVFKPAFARYYLTVLERQNGKQKDPELVPNTNQEEVNLEHVLPQNPSGAWSYIKDEIAKAFYNRLGNHALMQVSANTIAGNESFAKKRPIYGTSSFKLTAELANFASWDVADIESRQRAMAILAVQAWPIKVN